MENYYNDLTLEELDNEKEESEYKLFSSKVGFYSSIIFTILFAVLGIISLDNIMAVASEYTLPIGIVSGISTLVTALLSVHLGFDISSIKKDIKLLDGEINIKRASNIMAKSIGEEKTMSLSQEVLGNSARINPIIRDEEPVKTTGKVRARLRTIRESLLNNNRD